MHARGLIAAYPLSNPLIGGFARRFVLHGYLYDLIYSAGEGNILICITCDLIGQTMSDSNCR